jgi:transketolase C-terminal domain/subunit
MISKKTIQSVFQIQIAEANMIGIAAGLTRWKNFTGTLLTSTGRVYDQIRQSVAADKNKIGASHAGFNIREDGATQILEDIGLMKYYLE